MKDKNLYVPKYVRRILIDHDTCSAGVKKAAEWASLKFSNCEKPPVFVCLLKGAAPFYGKLIMNLKMEIVTDFMVVSSFLGKITRQARPKIITPLRTDIVGRDVILCDDIADSARTLKILKQYLLQKGAKSVTVMVFLDKPAGRIVSFKPDYACFTLKGTPFIIGYGLDIDERARNLPYIAEFDTHYLGKLDTKK